MAGPLPKPPPPTSRPLPSKPLGAAAARAEAAKAAPARSPGPATPAKPLGKAGARPLAKPAAKKPTTSRASTLPRERKTLDGPWEWAFDRMLERKRVADAAQKQQARAAAKRASAQRPIAPPPV